MSRPIQSLKVRSRKSCPSGASGKVMSASTTAPAEMDSMSGDCTIATTPEPASSPSTNLKTMLCVGTVSGCSSPPSLSVANDSRPRHLTTRNSVDLDIDNPRQGSVGDQVRASALRADEVRVRELGHEVVRDHAGRDGVVAIALGIHRAGEALRLSLRLKEALVLATGR